MKYNTLLHRFIQRREKALDILYFILSDDDFEIKSKIYSFNLRFLLKHILHSQDENFLNCRLVMVFGQITMSASDLSARIYRVTESIIIATVLYA